MLMVSSFSIFLLIEGFVFRTVINNTAGSLYYVVTQVTVSSFAHFGVFRFEVTDCPALHLAGQRRILPSTGNRNTGML